MSRYLLTQALPTRDCACGYCPEVIALHRAQRIRDIVAQQWAVAIALLSLTSCRVWSYGPDRLHPGKGAGWCLVFDDDAVYALAALPSAAEIVGGEP